MTDANDMITLTLPRARMTEIAWAVQEAAAQRAEEAEDGGWPEDEAKDNADMAEIFEARLVDIEIALGVYDAHIAHNRQGG